MKLNSHRQTDMLNIAKLKNWNGYGYKIGIRIWWKQNLLEPFGHSDTLNDLCFSCQADISAQLKLTMLQYQGGASAYKRWVKMVNTVEFDLNDGGSHKLMHVSITLHLVSMQWNPIKDMTFPSKYYQYIWVTFTCWRSLRLKAFQTEWLLHFSCGQPLFFSHLKMVLDLIIEVF